MRRLPDLRSPDDAAIVAAVRALEARLGSAYCVPLQELRELLRPRPRPSFTAFYVRVEVLTASGRLWSALGGLRRT